MRLSAVLIALVLSACATRMALRPEAEFREMAQREIQATPEVINADSVVGRFRECVGFLWKPQRMLCLKDFATSTRAKMNLAYPVSKQSEVENVFAASWPEAKGGWVKETHGARYAEGILLEAEQVEVVAQLRMYERLARWSQFDHRARSLYESHLDAVEKSNAAVYSYHQSLSESLKNTSSQLQIQGLRNQQKNCPPSNGARGIQVPCR